MRTTKVVENSRNDNVDTIAKSITNPMIEDILPTQDEDMSDIPGIQVSMATIVVDSSPLEEQQKLSDDNISNVSKKQQDTQSTELTEVSATNERSNVPIVIDLTNDTDDDSEDNDVKTIRNSSRSQSLRNVQITQRPVIMHQNISQQLSEQNSEKAINYQTAQVLPTINRTISSIEVPSAQQFQQLSIPLVHNASGPIRDNVQIMNILNTSSGNYKSVPPPSTFTTPNDDTLAVKLLNKEEVQQGIKRSHMSSYSHGDYYRDNYGRNFKRVAYDSGPSRSEYESNVANGNGSNDSGSRYGLGSEEHSSYHVAKTIIIHKMLTSEIILLKFTFADFSYFYV
ncbi:hypothetical protein GLOIN_2v1644298 [Rhizophagus clarus]|uniref:Uncharacterized protein n=1 Tax=Rhizophagus clarus TaxID=94130 RepID=A0A8H3R4M7_9GLOM|nr:hypothetical protein GLOIN_2v1644298 [Rhizophagus clarus]